MNKGNRILKFVSLFISLCCLVGMMSIVIYATELNKENDNVDYDALQLAKQDNDLMMNVRLKPIISAPVSDILSPVRVSFDNTDVLSYSIETEGLSAIEVTSGSMEFDITTIEEYGVLDVYATYADDIVVKSSIYTYCNENTVYVSEYSKKNALERYLENAVENNVYTLEEAEEIWSGFSCEGEFIESEIQAPFNIETTEIMATSILEGEGIICGTLTWTDDSGTIHPLRRVKVGIYKRTLGVNWRIASTFTDNTGFFSLHVSECEDVFIGVFAGDDNVKVKSPFLGFKYKVVFSEYTYDVVEGEVTTVSLPSITMDSDDGQAIQISQAALTARDFVWAMNNERPSNVKIKYPVEADNCYYSKIGNKINIIKRVGDSRYPNSYASWDTIMHEYGHHIQNDLNTSGSIGDGHSSTINMADHYKQHYVDNCFEGCDIECYLNDKLLDYSLLILTEDKCKREGDKIAWSEAWPTVFAIMAQDYYSLELSNIDTVTDVSYTSYREIDYNIENATINKGEACERSIMAVLWDIYDNNYEPHDNIAIGYQAFWNLSTIEGTYTFSDFMQNFYEEYPEYQYRIAPILEKYAMATTTPTVSNIESISINTPATVTWGAQGGSYHYPNNRFSIIVYHNNEVIFRKDNISTNIYAFSIDEWREIFLKDEYDCKEGINIDIAIVAYQDDGESYTTGPYYSNLQTITINHNYRYEETDGTYHSYICEDCGRIENCEHNLGCVDVDDEKRYYACFECEYAYSVAHNYIPYNSCYEKCSECGYKNQIAEHDYTYAYLPNPDDTETHFAYCECGKKLMTPQEHSFIQSAFTDTCEFCGISKNHVHYYTYTPCGDGETHRKSCACGNTQYQQCFGMTMPGQLSRCSMCRQILKGGLILPLGEEDAVLPSNKEDDPEEETE